jgi:polysaccharide pyruvyl transferase WcaK-like protein
MPHSNGHQIRQVYLVSAAGGNFGDDLITTAWLRFYAQAYPDATVYCDVWDPSLFSWHLAKHFPDLKPRVVSTLWSYTKTLPDNHWEALRSARLDTAAKRVESLRLLTDTAGCADVVHLAGGGYINSEWPRNLGILPIVEHLRLSGGSGRLIWTGASILPLAPIVAFDYSSCFRAFDHISTRDKGSQDILAKHNPSTEFTCDDFYVAACMKLLPARKRAVRSNTVLLLLQRDLFNTEDFMTAHRALSDFVRSAPAKSHFVYPELNVFHDKLAYDLLPQKHRPIEFVSYSDFWSLLLHKSHVLNSLKKAISSRYHLHMLLDYLGKPGQWISASAYYDNKHQTLSDNFGSSWTKFPLGTQEERLVEQLEPGPTPPSKNELNPPKQGVANPRSRQLSYESLKAKEIARLYPLTRRSVQQASGL